MLSQLWAQPANEEMAKPSSDSTHSDPLDFRREGSACSQSQQHTVPRAQDQSTTPEQAENAAPKSTMENSIAMMPVTMSCRQVFDDAMRCQGLTGAFRSLYRYGKWRDCSEEWSDFWFCLGVRSKPEDTKRAMIQERYWEKEEKFRSRPNSEDIWQERSERVTTFFKRDPNKEGVFDGLWARPPAELEELNRAKFQE